MSRGPSGTEETCLLWSNRQPLWDIHLCWLLPHAKLWNLTGFFFSLPNFPHLTVKWKVPVMEQGHFLVQRMLDDSRYRLSIWTGAPSSALQLLPNSFCEVSREVKFSNTYSSQLRQRRQAPSKRAWCKGPGDRTRIWVRILQSYSFRGFGLGLQSLRRKLSRWA